MTTSPASPRARFGVPLGSVQHRIVVVGSLLVLAFAILVGGRDAWPIALAAALVSLGAHVGVLGALALSLAAVLGWITRVARVKDVERLLDEAHLTGDETLLDLGCGDGLVAVSAARRLTRGRVIALDDWRRPHGARAIDPETTRQNAQREGVGDRVEVRTSQLSAIALEDASVDVAIACFSLHHLPESARASAVREIARVVRPGGRILLAEPAHREALARALSANGVIDVTLRERTFPRAVFGWVVGRQAASARSTSAISSSASSSPTA